MHLVEKKLCVIDIRAAQMLSVVFRDGMGCNRFRGSP